VEKGCSLLGYRGTSLEWPVQRGEDPSLRGKVGWAETMHKTCFLDHMGIFVDRGG